VLVLEVNPVFDPNPVAPLPKGETAVLADAPNPVFVLFPKTPKAAFPPLLLAPKENAMIKYLPPSYVCIT
jgi:hypothetical protein